MVIKVNILAYFSVLSIVSVLVVSIDSPNHFENEFDETVPTELREDDVENEILDWLGLSEPDMNHNWTSESLSQSAPNFLLKMYEMINSEFPLSGKFNGRRERRHTTKNVENRLISPLDEMELQESDIIMTFMSNRIPLFNEPLFKNWLPNIIWFNISQIPDELSLMNAQLKVYKREAKEINKYYEIFVYAISFHAKNELELTLISSLKTESDHERWLELDVTKAVRKWQKRPVTNQGFFLEASITDGASKRDVSLVSAGVSSLEGTDNMKAFMVGYFKNDENQHPKKSSSPPARRRRRQNHNKNGRTTNSELSKNQRNCQRLNFSVDFKKLNWLNWIVAPEKFDSYFCSGDCSFPLNDINTTNHAIIQTLAHLKNPDLPKPCCAPTALTSIVIIYHVSQDVVNMKKYSNMVVESCGCL